MTNEAAANERLRKEAALELIQFESEEDNWKARRCTRPVSEGGCKPGKAVTCEYCTHAPPYAPIV